MKILLQALLLTIGFAVGSSCKGDKSEPPVSLSTVVDELNREHSEEGRKKIFDSPAKVTGFQLRDRYELWNDNEKSAVRLFFEQQGIKHPDWISECILEAWKNSNSPEGLRAEELLREYAEKQREWEEWTEDLRKHPEKYMSEDDPLAPDPFATDSVEPESEQAGAGQPATRSESDSEGGDKPQPEAEGRSR